MTVRTCGICRIGPAGEGIRGQSRRFTLPENDSAWLGDAQGEVVESLRNLQSELTSRIEALVETADDDIATFLDASHPELAAQFDEEWRSTILGDEGEPSVLSEKQDPASAQLLARLRQAGRAKVLDTLGRGDFRELLPDGLRETPIEPGLLKPYLESAAPRLEACGGSRRLWLAGRCDAPIAMLRAAIGLETAQLPSVAVDTHSDFVVGWEMEGLSLPRVAASLVDNQPDTAQLALRLHTRLDIAW